MYLTTTVLALFTFWGPSLTLAGEVDDNQSGFTIGPADGITDNSIPYKHYSTDDSDFGNCIEVGDGNTAKAVRIEAFKGVRIVIVRGPDAGCRSCPTISCWFQNGPFVYDDFSSMHDSTGKYIWFVKVEDDD